MAQMLYVKFTLLSLSLVFLSQLIHGWGTDGHSIVCIIAQSRLSEEAKDAVKELLPEFAEGNLANACSWADRVKFRYHWSSALHYINVPDSLCTFQYNRDCKDEDGVKDRCVAGAINNYTSQLLTYKNDVVAARHSTEYNLTEALMFLGHFIGDIHQPLHVGHTTDKGGNTIDVHWYTRKTVLHHVWDDNILETEETMEYEESVQELAAAIKQNITDEWADQVPKWESCDRSSKPTCPDIYASESISAACNRAYKGVEEGSTLEDDYYLSRRLIANQRLAQAGVRLAATLNRIFGKSIH